MEITLSSVCCVSLLTYFFLLLAVLKELYYPDGHSPPPEIIAKWLTILAETFDTKGPDETPCIAIHCVAGLGRYGSATRH